MAGLIDIHGNSLRLQKEPQTENDAKLAQLRRHYSEHPTVGLTPGKAAAAPMLTRPSTAVPLETTQTKLEWFV